MSRLRPARSSPTFAQRCVAATKAPDCGIAAAAAFALVRYHALGPPKPPATMRTLCVVASYERLLRENETSPLGDLMPKRGLELVRIAYDPDAVVGSDGIDPRHTTDLIPPYAAVFPESEDLVRAFAHCKGTTCSSRRARVSLHDPRWPLARIEVDERPPCAP